MSKFSDVSYCSSLPVDFVQTIHSSDITLHSCKCHSAWCPECQKLYGWKLRNELFAKQDMFSDVGLLTLTIDPKKFASPLDAFQMVTRGNGKGKVSYIAELLRSFHIRNWFKVLEFQKNGFPHWHIMIDLSELPPCYILPDGTKVVAPMRGKSERWYQLAMKRFRERISVPGARLLNPHYLDMEALRRKWHEWGLGTQVNLRVKSRHSGKHGFKYALNYITKYITCANKNSLPAWAMCLSRLRRFSCSSSIGRILMKSGGTSGDESRQVASVWDRKRFDEILAVEKSRLGEEFDRKEYWRYGSEKLAREEEKFEKTVDARARAVASSIYQRECLQLVQQRNTKINRKVYSSARPVGVKVSTCGLSTVLKTSEGEVFGRLGFSLAKLEKVVELRNRLVASENHGFYNQKIVSLDSSSGAKLERMIYDNSIREGVRKLEYESVRDGMLARSEKLGCSSLVKNWISSNGSRLLLCLAL